MATEMAPLPTQITGQPVISERSLDQSLVDDLGLEEIRDIDELFESARARFQHAARSLVESGVRFKQLKERLSHGEWEPFLKSHGFAQQRAYEAMRAVDVVSLLPPDERKAMLEAPPSKLIFLSRMKDEDLRLLVESSEFEVVIELPDSDLRKWIKKNVLARFRKKLNAAMTDNGVRQEILDEAAARPRPEPRQVTTGRNELLSNVVRARIELERARKIVDKLLPHVNDDWETARLELAHAARKIIAAVSAEAVALDTDLATRFGAATVKPMEGAYKTLGESVLRATETACAAQADGDLAQRATARAHATKWKGTPPRSVNSVIEHANKDGADE